MTSNAALPKASERRPEPGPEPRAEQVAGLPAEPGERTADEDNRSGARVALLVLGMHRSGTSVLSGILARLGCDIPATPMASDERNTRGFYESRPISALNNVILASAGTGWDSWNAVNADWYDSPRRAAFAESASELVVQEFGASPLIVLKDPRISVLAPFWIDVLRGGGFAPRIAFAYRSPADVAASLAERNGFDPAIGQLIWLRYVLEGERASRDLPRVFVSYDRLLSDWSAETGRIQDALDVRLPRQSDRVSEEVETFLSPSMRHFDSGSREEVAGTRYHPWIGDAAAILDRWSRSGKGAADAGADREVLDRIGAELGRALPAFDRLIRIAKDRPQSEAALTARIAEVQAEKALANAERSKAATALEQREAAARDDRDALDRANRRIGGLEADLEQATTSTATIETELEALKAEMSRRGEVLLEQEQKIDDLSRSIATMSQGKIAHRADLDRATKRQAAIEAALDKANATLSKTNAALAKANAALANSNAARADANAALIDANAEISRIMNSSSVKLTAPLRRVRALIGKKQVPR